MENSVGLVPYDTVNSNGCSHTVWYLYATQKSKHNKGHLGPLPLSECSKRTKHFAEQIKGNDFPMSTNKGKYTVKFTPLSQIELKAGSSIETLYAVYAQNVFNAVQSQNKSVYSPTTNSSKRLRWDFIKDLRILFSEQEES